MEKVSFQCEKPFVSIHIVFRFKWIETVANWKSIEGDLHISHFKL